jgi:hypothetical protein
MSVGVHDPTGAPISDPGLSVELQVRSPGGDWTTVGTGTPTAGIATISYSIPAVFGGQNVTVRAVASGASYLTETSAGATATLPLTAAEVTAALLAARNAVAMKAPTVDALSRLGRFSLKFNVPGAGHFALSWYVTVQGKRQLLGSASVSVKQPGTTTVTLGLSAAARRLLKNSKRVKLTEIESFSPLQGTKGSLHSTLTLQG